MGKAKHTPGLHNAHVLAAHKKDAIDHARRVGSHQYTELGGDRCYCDECRIARAILAKVRS